MTEYVKKSDVLELLSLPKDLIAEYVCDLKGLWIDDDEAEQTEPSNSEKPNNCEHITEDGVTCAKYPACDDCLDNPLNKVKGSERLVKGSEQTKSTISKMEQVDKDINVRSKDKPNCEECKHFHENAVMYLDQCDFCFKDCKYEPKDEPQTDMDEDIVRSYGFKVESYRQAKAKDEPQTDCGWK